MGIYGIQKKNIIQRLGYCLLQEVAVSRLKKFLFALYTKLLTISCCIYFITLEKYYTVHLTTQVKKHHRSFYKIFA